MKGAEKKVKLRGRQDIERESVQWAWDWGPGEEIQVDLRW